MTEVWAEEGGVRFSTELKDGLVICRISEYDASAELKEIAKASVAFFRWERLMAEMHFKPYLDDDHKPTGWTRVVPT